MAMGPLSDLTIKTPIVITIGVFVFCLAAKAEGWDRYSFAVGGVGGLVASLAGASSSGAISGRIGRRSG